MDELEKYKRANFFPGLQVGPEYWNKIEDYHFGKEKLYNKLFHGYGIVPNFLDSLHVQAEKTKGGLVTFIVGRGLCFDGLGNPLFLYEPQVLVFDSKKYTYPCTIHIVIKYSEVLQDFFQNTENIDLQGYQYKLETAKVDLVQEITEPDITVELARVKLEDPEGTGISEIANCDDFRNPGPNALDYRFVPWAVRTERGVSMYLEKLMIDLFEYTCSVSKSCNEIFPLASLKSMYTVAMTSKMIIQTAGVFFDDVIHLLTPLFDIDHEVLFELADYEREHEDENYNFTTKEEYENARNAMYTLGELLKKYSNKYEEIDLILGEHKKIIDGLKNTIIEKEVTSNDIQFISYKMPRVLLFEEEKYTLVDTINMASAESIEAHRMTFINTKHPSTVKDSFYYPDGTLVYDTIKRWVGGAMKFHLKNIVKGRKTLIIRRTDIYQGNYSVTVTLQGKNNYTMNVDGVDTKNRWRNIYLKINEGEITEYTPEVMFDIGEKGRDNSGTIWVYQLL